MLEYDVPTLTTVCKIAVPLELLNALRRCDVPQPQSIVRAAGVDIRSVGRKMQLQYSTGVSGEHGYVLAFPVDAPQN